MTELPGTHRLLRLGEGWGVAETSRSASFSPFNGPRKLG